MNDFDITVFDEPINSPGSPFDGVTGLIRTYDYLPYSPYRIKQIMREEYGIDVEWIHPYKCGRYPGYKRRYKLFDRATGEAISEIWYSNDDLRYFLASKGYPLYAPKVKRNPGCVAFLEAVAEAEQKVCK